MKKAGLKIIVIIIFVISLILNFVLFALVCNLSTNIKSSDLQTHQLKNKLEGIK